MVKSLSLINSPPPTQQFNNNKSTFGRLLTDCPLSVIYQKTANRFFGEQAVLQFYLTFDLVKYDPGNDWKHPLVTCIFMLQAFVLLVMGLTTSVVVIWYSFVLPAILLYTTPWIVLHIATAHWLLINIVFHYFKAVFTSPGRALQVRPCNCRQQEEPAILIFRLLLHMHRMYVASINLFGLPLKMNGMHRTQFDRLCLDFLSLIIWSRKFKDLKRIYIRIFERSSLQASIF